MTTNTFATIIEIFSALVGLFLVIFLAWWILSRRAEYGRHRRILMSKRDASALCGLIRNDAKRASQILATGRIEESGENELKFIFSRIDENLKKMDSYLIKGIDLIGKYDVIKKYNKEIKFK